jgi:hypothetical protein
MAPEGTAALRLDGATRIERMEKLGAGPRDIAPPTDWQVAQGSEALRNMPELRPEVWQGMSDAAKLDTCKEIERRMAAIQGCPPVEVSAKPMEPGYMGGYSRADRAISLSQEHLHSGHPNAVGDTMLHEGRHAYQHHAVEHYGFHQNPGEVETWRYNMDHYTQPWMDPFEYQRQPIEADASGYAAQILKQAQGG